MHNVNGRVTLNVAYSRYLYTSSWQTIGVGAN